MGIDTNILLKFDYGLYPWSQCPLYKVCQKPTSQLSQTSTARNHASDHNLSLYIYIEVNATASLTPPTAQSHIF
jgi:hypothetical protein